jgi:Family of unknown function (DUF6136)
MMLSYRLRWYAVETSRVVRRHWQALSLSFLLLLPTMPVFAQTRILGAPVLETLAPTHGVEWRFVWVHALEAVSMLWVLIQRTAITGGPFATYLRSLPTPNGHRRAVDVAVVLIASTPLLLPVLAAAIALAFLPQKGTHYLYVLDLMLITLGWQLTVLSRSTRNALPLVVANIVLVSGLQTDHAVRPALLVIALLLAAFAVARTPTASALRPEWLDAITRQVARVARVRVGLGLPSAAKLQIGIVGHHAASAFGRCLTMGSVTATTCFLLRLWEFDARVVPLTLISQAVIALIAGTTYRDLRAAHLRAAHFMRSLPLTEAAHARADVLTVATLALPFAAVAPLILVAQGLLSLWEASTILLSGAPLLALLRLPQRYAPRESVLLGAMLAAAWVAVAWQFFA